jgi:hypothetical protein
MPALVMAAGLISLLLVALLFAGERSTSCSI